VIKRADSLPPFTLALVAVALMTVAVLLPYLSGAFPAGPWAMHVNAADAAFSAVLAVCWLYAASKARIYFDPMKRRVVFGDPLRCYGPVVALFAIYMLKFHRSVNLFRATAVFVLSILLCESLWKFASGLSKSTARRALVLGTGRLASTVWRDLRTQRLPGLSFVGFAGESYREEYCPDIAARYVGDLSELKGIVLEKSVDDLIIATPATDGTFETERAIEVAANLGVRVWMVRQALGVPDYAVRDITSDYIELVADPEPSAIKSTLKRALDLLLSASVLVVGSPFAFLALVRESARGSRIRLDCQVRVGLHRRLFKIRRVHTPSGMDWIHELLNKYLLMWNVLRGEMSMVGPRPLSLEDLARFEIPESMGRFGIRPGLTGGRESETSDNIYASPSGRAIDYAEQWSLAGDLVVLFRAARAFVQRNTATHVETGAL